MTRPRPPNLFIIGAPKCGTTALSHYLAGHPDIFMSEQAGVKEPQFYNHDRKKPNAWRTPSRSEYEAIYSGAPATAAYWGEASPQYLYSRVAVPELLKDSPKARLIVMLRNPVEIVPALHNEYMKGGNEIPDLEKAWALQNDRRHGRNMPPHHDGERNDFLQYGRVARLGEQLQRLYSQAPCEQVHTIVYDDFKKSPGLEYKRLLDWLALPHDGRAAFPVMNKRVGYRFKALEHGLRRVRQVREHLGLPGGLGLHAAINRFNIREGNSTLRPAFKRQLENYFRDDVQLLSQILKRDLTHWLRTP